MASNTTANSTAGNTGKPPMTNMTIIATKAIPMNTGMWSRGHSYQPLSSTYSSPFSPVKALLISLKMLAKVGGFLSSPEFPPPRMAPIAMILT